MSKVTGFVNTQKIKEEAAIWLLKIEEESPLPDEDVDALRLWVETSDTHKQVIARMSKTWGDMDVLNAMMVPTVSRKWTPWQLFKTWLLSPLVALLYLLDKSIRYPIAAPYSRGIATAAILMILLGVWVFLPYQTPASNIYKTRMGEQTHHTLADGSSLWLNSSSHVEVIYSESYRRIRLFEGEAHFDVSKDIDRPFEVYSRDRLVRAVGTAFSVYKLDDSIQVFVSEGTVELAIVAETLVLKPDDYPVSDNAKLPSETNDLFATVSKDIPADISTYLGELEAGQSVSISTEAGDLDITTYEDAVVQHDVGEVIRKLSWLDGKLVFAGESLEQVVTEISRHTPMRIDVPDPTLRNMRIGGHFQAGDTDALFFVLESGFGIHVNKLSANHVELKVKK